MRISKTKRLTLASLFLALGIILPFVTSHALGLPGTVLLPMHLPVFLCGIIAGPLYGGFCGLVLPLLNSLLTGMPSLFPMAPIMTAELFCYGLVSGLISHKTPLGRKRYGVYISLITAMTAGRVAYGLVFELLILGQGELRALSVWAALLTGLPGITVQLLLIPTVTFAIGGFNSMQNKNAVQSAKNLIESGKATCVVIKDGKIVNIECDRGIKPIIAMYEQGLLEGATVVDKIVGRAAAMIMVLGGVRSCYGLTVSLGAAKVFEEHKIAFEYTSCPEHIINRDGTDICPMEKAVMNINEPIDALVAVRLKLAELAGERKNAEEK